jgi:hypothetical protein
MSIERLVAGNCDGVGSRSVHARIASSKLAGDITRTRVVAYGSPSLRFSLL